MNIYDVSKQAGVSIATVSRVLNGGAGVSQKTRDRVMQVMQQSGYQPNAFARGLGLNTMRIIGLLTTDIADPFLAQAIAHLERRLRARGYDCLLCCTGSDAASRERDLGLMMSKRVDALIFVGSGFVSATGRENGYILRAAEKLPVMVLNGLLSGENIYCTLLDDEQASYQAAMRLIELGCRRLLHLCHIQSYAGIRKIAGFRRALQQSGLSAPPDCVQLAPLSEAGAVLGGLFQRARCDGILTSDDALGVAALKFAKAHGIAVPDELRIIGYNNSSYALCTEPELSSVDNKLEAVCQQTVTTLMGVLDGQSMPNTTIFGGELIERGTT